MALLWMDGFDKYGDGGGGATCEPAGILTTRYAMGGSHFYPQAGRFGGYALAIAWSALDWIQTPQLTTDRTLIVGFSMKCVSGYEDGPFLHLVSPNNWSLSLVLESDGALSFEVNGGNLDSTSAGVVTLDTWLYVELKIYCDNSAGTYELRVDGVNVMSGSGDTQSDSDNYYGAVRLTSSGTTINNVPWIDDLWICDSTGSDCNDFLGTGYRVLTLSPDDDGDSTDWDYSTYPTHADNIDEDEQIITDYVKSVTTDDLDLYEYEDTAALNNIKGVQIVTEAAITDTVNHILKSVIKHSSTEDSDAGQTVGTSEPTSFLRLMAENPVTTTAWISSDIQNLQAGIKVG